MSTRARLRSPVVMLVAAATGLLLAGCTGSQDEPPATPAAARLGHIHGLGVDPADGDLIVAAHRGVFRIPEGGDPRLIAGRAQDTMAFTITGPSTFLASGHPAPTDTSQPASLGLIESTDGAQTWTPRSLAGTADFHVLEPTDAGTYGWDSRSGALMVTDDLKTWTTVATGQLNDVAANPGDPDDLLATTPTGLRTVTANSLGELVGDRDDIALIERPTADLVVAVTGDAEVLTSADRGLTWAAGERLEGQTQALATDQAGWHLATTTGVWTSSDQGATWARVLDLR